MGFEGGFLRVPEFRPKLLDNSFNGTILISILLSLTMLAKKFYLTVFLLSGGWALSTKHTQRVLEGWNCALSVLVCANLQGSIKNSIGISKSK